jgi:hypothetical protein
LLDETSRKNYNSKSQKKPKPIKLPFVTYQNTPTKGIESNFIMSPVNQSKGPETINFGSAKPFKVVRRSKLARIADNVERLLGELQSVYPDIESYQHKREST